MAAEVRGRVEVARAEEVAERAMAAEVRGRVEVARAEEMLVEAGTGAAATVEGSRGLARYRRRCRP